MFLSFDFTGWAAGIVNGCGYYNCDAYMLVVVVGSLMVAAGGRWLRWTVNSCKQKAAGKSWFW